MKDGTLALWAGAAHYRKSNPPRQPIIHPETKYDRR